MTDLCVGKLAGHNESFCPYAAVTKWPYRHLYGNDSQQIAEKYFAYGAFRERGWTFYYIRTKLDNTPKPLLLIPEREVEDLFREIRETLRVQVTFPDMSSDSGFQLSFEQEGSPRPRYLGRLTNHCSVLELEEMIPVEGSAAEEPEELDESSFPLFRRKMQAAILAGKNKSKAAREKKKKDRVVLKSRWCAELKRSQCYLGLRPRASPEIKHLKSNKGPNLTWEESEKAQKEYEIKAGLRVSPLDISVASPYQFDRNVVFICVDIESYERDHNKITEIGVSTLDTLDLARLAPGPGGEEWMKLIRSRHFRVAEYAHLNNSEFVSGCADSFQEQFGKSEWISIKEAPQVMASCFKAPFSGPGQYTRYPSTLHEVPGNVSKIQPLVNDNAAPKRNLVLMGHDTASDITYMRKVGYDVGNLPNVIEAVDTVNLYRAFKHEQNPRNLGGVLLGLDLIGWNLHNAGNDAAYTMQALIGISIAAMNPRNKPPRQPTDEQLDEAAMEAKARVMEESDEWEAADEESGDGGDATGIKPAVEWTTNDSDQDVVSGTRNRNPRRGVSSNTITGRMTRASRSGNKGAGGGDRSRYGGSKPTTESKTQDQSSESFDPSAWDDAFGTSDAGWASEQNGGVPSTEQLTPAKSGVVPPHLRPPRTTQTKEVLVEQTGEAKVVLLPEITEKMAERLKILDDGW